MIHHTKNDFVLVLIDVMFFKNSLKKKLPTKLIVEKKIIDKLPN